jgi:hypothetical protein
MKTLTRKVINVKLDDPETGAVSADIATLDIVDKDRDVTRKGFFGTQNVSIVSSHDWGDVMLGKGVITDNDGKKARFKGLLNLDDPDGAKLHAKLKFDMNPDHGPPLIEWSYGFDLKEDGFRPLDPEQNDGAIQELKPSDDGSPGADIAEVSPVVLGAGEGTGTTGVKTGKPMKLVDQVEKTTEQINALSDRVTEVRKIRDGKLGQETMDALAGLKEAVETLDDVVTSEGKDDGRPPEVHEDQITLDELTLAASEAEARLRGIG